MLEAKKNIIISSLRDCSYEDFISIMNKLEVNDNLIKFKKEVFDCMLLEKEEHDMWIKSETMLYVPISNYDMESEFILKSFKTGKRFYIIKDGKIQEHIVHSGISPRGAYILSKIYVMYDDWADASEALKNYKKHFNIEDTK